MTTPLDALFDKADLRCAVCDASRGGCDCWTQCDCGWSFRKATKCRNPVHGGKAQPLEVVAFGKGKLT